MYIKLHQTQIETIESERSLEEILAILPTDEDECHERPLYLKNTDIPWSQLCNKDTVVAAAKGNVTYFAENQLNNIIITDTILDKKTTLINFLREILYDSINDDDDFYEVIKTERSSYNAYFIIEE